MSDFKVWRDEVIGKVRTALGIGILPDIDFWSYWNSGLTADEAASEAVAMVKNIYLI